MIQNQGNQNLLKKIVQKIMLNLSFQFDQAKILT